MAYSTPEQLSFHPVAGHTIRADFEGGALSSDFGVLLLRGIDRQIGLHDGQMLHLVRFDRRWNETHTTLQGRRLVHLLSCHDTITQLGITVLKMPLGKHRSQHPRGCGM